VNFAKKLAKQLPATFSLKKYLHEHMGGYDPPRSVHVLHASEMTRDLEFCPRSFALMRSLNETPKASYVETSLRYTYDLGRLIEQGLREIWAKDIAVGDWACTSCGLLHSFQFRPWKCSSCSSGRFVYREVRFTSQICGASGSVDVLVKLPGYEKAVMVEAKSMDKDMWKSLVAPMAEHRLRTNLYLRLIAESDHPYREFIDTDKAFILYMVKGYGTADASLEKLGINENFTPFKEYVIKRNDEETQPLVDRAIQLKLWEDGNGAVIYPDRICEAANTSRASKCPVKTPCFAHSNLKW
jgi:hypothetical protein